MTSPVPRRWFSFSLRTLFVVVGIVCVFLAGYLAGAVTRAHEAAWQSSRIGYLTQEILDLKMSLEISEDRAKRAESRIPATH